MGGIDLKTIIQGGAVGIAVLLIVSDIIKTKLNNKIIGNHLSHLNDTLIKFSNIIQQSNDNNVNLKNILSKNNELLTRTGYIMEKVEKKLD